MKSILPGVAREEFPALLVARDYRVGAEIGVSQGHHAVHLLKGWLGFLILVDCWQHQDNKVYCDVAAGWTDPDQERNYCMTVESMAPYADRVKVMRAFSVEAAKDVPDESLDWVYIDANHSYHAVCEDLQAWYPKVRSGGLISGHDFVDSGEPFGVKSAVLEFIQELPVDLYVSGEEWPTWHFEKP